MPLSPTNQIDIVVKRPGCEDYDLFICDDGSENDEITRYNWFISKLQAYLEFVFSGQIESQYPDSKGKNVRVVVICSRPPNEAMTKIEAVKDRTAPASKLDVTFMTMEEYTGTSKIDSKPWWKFW